MKRTDLSILRRAATIACVFALAACDGTNIIDDGGEEPPATVAVTGVTLDKTELIMVEGAEETLQADVQPEDATDKSVTWSVDKPEVASVENGVVTAIAEGTATVTVKTTDGNHTATCTLTVNRQVPPEVAVTGVELDKTELTLVVGASEMLTATISPSDATNKNVTWSSSNPAAVSVNVEGKVTALEGGDPVTITVTTEDGAFEATCTVTVTIPVIGVELSQTELSLEKDDSATLTAILLPGMATDQHVTWTTTASDIVQIAPDGLDCTVTGIAAGIATVTAKTRDGGFEASCTVTVTAAHPLFGTVSFRTTDTKTVGGQIWSDVVMGSACPTEGFDAGYQDSPKAACRNDASGGGYGTFFSWPAVDEYKSVLCPDGWQVPTAEDFNTLNTALGGTLDNYVNIWGAEYGGEIWNGGYHARAGQHAKYWAQTAVSNTHAYTLHLINTGTITPNQSLGKNSGHNLRCVKAAN